MNDDIRPDESEEERGDQGTGGRAVVNRNGAVTSTYTDISGDPVFVISATNRPDAWLAVPDGVELDVEDRR